MLTAAAARKLAKDLFTGSASPAWAQRAKRAKTLLAKIVGDAPRVTPIPTPYAGEGEALLASARVRREIDPTVRRWISALLEGKAQIVASHLDEEVWAMFGNGKFGRYPGEDLELELAEGKFEASEIEATKRRSYSAAEARNAFAFGIPEALDEMFGLRSVFLYAFSAGAHGRLMIAVRPTDSGPKLASLPLPSIDEAWAYSIRAQADEDGGIAAAAKLVRHFVLEHGAALESMRGDLMDALWLGAGETSAEAFMGTVGLGAPALEGAERIFATTRPLVDDIGERIGPELVKNIERSAPKKWRAKFEDLHPRWLETTTLTIDPNTLGPGTEKPIIVLVLKIEEPDGTGEKKERWKVGGVFDDPSEPKR